MTPRVTTGSDPTKTLGERSGLWSFRASEDPPVRVREEKRAGSNVVLDYTDRHLGRKKRTLKHGVRKPNGKIDRELAARAITAAKDQAAALRLKIAPPDEPLRMSVGGAFALYHDPTAGALYAGAQALVSPNYLLAHKRARRFWEAELGVATPFNAVTPARVEQVAKRIRAQGVARAIGLVKHLGIVARWLRDAADMEGIKDPTRKFDERDYRSGAQPRRPRYTEDEAAALIDASRRVDPRFRLLLAFIDTAGTRAGQIRAATRRALDRPLANAPPREMAPHGWIVFGGVKGQRDHVVFLDLWQREEIMGALGGYHDEEDGRWRPGYLARFEAAHQAGELDDYLLFPGSTLHLADRKRRASRERAPDAAPSKSISASRLNHWVLQAERIAGIPHVPGRALHGMRRAWAKRSRVALGREAAARAGGWEEAETMDMYAGEDYESLAASREFNEQRRSRKR